MNGKVLGKISSVEFGLYPDRPFLMGIDFEFSLNGGCEGTASGGRYLVNMSPECKWDHPSKRSVAIEASIDRIKQWLEDAKVDYVSELKNIPVEVTVEDNCFKDFRILTEVL